MYKSLRVEFKNSKIVHKNTPLTSLIHCEDRFYNDSDREYDGIHREHVVKSNRDIWQIWLNDDFKLKNRLSFYKDSSYLFETFLPFLNIKEDEDVLRRLRNESRKSNFIAITDLNRYYFCKIIDNLLKTIKDEDKYLFFNQFSEDMIYFIWVYITTFSNNIKNVPKILLENYPKFYLSDDIKNAFRNANFELFSFLKRLFINHGFRIVGSGIRMALCQNNANTSKINSLKIARIKGYDYVATHSRYNLNKNSKYLSNWSQDCYKNKKSTGRSRRKKLLKYGN